MPEKTRNELEFWLKELQRAKDLKEYHEIPEIEKKIKELKFQLRVLQAELDDYYAPWKRGY